jgi:hypothetical protein
MGTSLQKSILFSALLAVSASIAQETDGRGFTHLAIDDFTKLRLAYAESRNFDPSWNTHDDRDKIKDLWDNDKVDEGMKLAKEWLEKHPVDAEMHRWYAYFLKGKGDIQGYFRHLHCCYGLLASITSSGTGFSPDSPMKVIAVVEEYTVIKLLGAKFRSQALMANKAGVACDKMKCDMKGKEITLYFDVTIPMAHTSKMLRGTDDSKKDPPEKRK